MDYHGPEPDTAHWWGRTLFFFPKTRSVQLAAKLGSSVVKELIRSQRVMCRQ
jgi:hypothetical protein